MFSHLILSFFVSFLIFTISFLLAFFVSFSITLVNKRTHIHTFLPIPMFTFSLTINSYIYLLTFFAYITCLSSNSFYLSFLCEFREVKNIGERMLLMQNSMQNSIWSFFHLYSASKNISSPGSFYIFFFSFPVAFSPFLF